MSHKKSQQLAKTTISVSDNDINVIRVGEEDYLSLTDIARYKNPENPSDTIKKWLSNYDTIEYLGLWEQLSGNPNFNSAEFRQIKIEAPKKAFTMSPNQWCRRVNPIGIIASRGKYSTGTFAYSDIALEFASWIDNIFKLYLIKEFKRLKQDESYHNKIEWTVRRSLSKTNYKIQTDSIKTNIIPHLSEEQINYAYATEADIINIALFGETAKQWRSHHPHLAGNIRDYASILQLIILSNLEVINASLISEHISQKERIKKLNQIARNEALLLSDNDNPLIEGEVK